MVQIETGSDARPQRPPGRTWKSGLLSLCAAAALAACGGGGGGITDGSLTPATTAVGVRVIDGAIRNALVCLDTSRNGRCDSGEPSARTDASGNATLDAAAADAGKYPVVAMVGTDAVDADHGPVTVPFVMKAPADQPAVVSPLTTLVQTTVEQTGASTGQAVSTVQSQLGMSVSVMQDYTQSTSTESGTLAAVARLVVVTQQEQASTLSAAVGTTAIDGSVVTQADLDKLIAQRIAELLPAIVSALSDPAVQAAITAGDATALNTALQPLADNIVSSGGITTEAVATLVGVNNQVASSTDAPVTTAGATLHTLNFGTAKSWFRRIMTTNASQAQPDAEGNVAFRDNRLRSVSSNDGSIVQQAAWSTGSDPDRQSDVHWNGSAWVNCGLAQDSKGSPRDAQGRSTYNYCDGFETGTSSRSAFDVAGKTMLEVYNQIRSAGYTNITIQNATTVLGGTTFPAGSQVLYYSGMPTGTAVSYIPKTNQHVRIHKTDAAAAGDTTACENLTGPFTSYTIEAGTLEQLVSRTPGIPCSFGEGTATGSGGVTLTSGTPNEYWGLATVSVGQVGNAPLTGSASNSTSYYTTNQLLRVGFGTGNAANYYNCRQRAWDGSPRNCSLAGTGTYSIEALGDARVMTFQDMPPQFSSLGYDRVFVERGGNVHYGFKSRPTATKHARLNEGAGNALLQQLGVPTFSADSVVSLTAASYQGEWIVWPTVAAGGHLSDQAKVVRIFPIFDGSAPTGFQCFDAIEGAPTASLACTFTLDPGTGAATLGDAGGTGSFTLDFVKGTGSGTYGATPVSVQRR